jgi:hypothetical protein
MIKVEPSAFSFNDLFIKEDKNGKTEFILMDILIRWYQLNKDNKKSVMLSYFFSVMYDKWSYQEGLFLLLCGFLESYYEYNFNLKDKLNIQKRIEILNIVIPYVNDLTDADTEYKENLFDVFKKF